MVKVSALLAATTRNNVAIPMPPQPWWQKIEGVWSWHLLMALQMKTLTSYILGLGCYRIAILRCNRLPGSQNIHQTAHAEFFIYPSWLHQVRTTISLLVWQIPETVYDQGGWNAVDSQRKASFMIHSAFFRGFVDLTRTPVYRKLSILSMTSKGTFGPLAPSSVNHLLMER